MNHVIGIMVVFGLLIMEQFHILEGYVMLAISS